MPTLPETFLQCGTRSVCQHCRRPFCSVAREVRANIAGGLFAVWHEKYVLTLPEAFLECGTRSMYEHCWKPFCSVAREVCTIIAGGLFLCGTRRLCQHCRRPFCSMAREVCTNTARGIFAVWHEKYVLTLPEAFLHCGTRSMY